MPKWRKRSCKERESCSALIEHHFVGKESRCLCVGVLLINDLSVGEGDKC